MNIDYAEKYKSALEKIENSVHDITLSFQGDSKAKSQYRVIPFSKKGKKFIRFDAADMKTLESTSIFVSPQTAGVKLYDEKHNYQCDYSVSRKGTKQVIQLNFADGTGLKQTYALDSSTNKYVLTDTTEIIKAADEVNLDGYSDNIINKDLLLYNMYQQVKGTSAIGFFVAYGDKDTHTDRSAYYNLGEHPELSKISKYLTSIHIDLINNYISCRDILEPSQFSREVFDFYQTFRNFLRKMEQEQNGQDTSGSGPEDR